MPTQQENRARLAIAAQAYIDAYLAKYYLSVNPAGASQSEWEADASTEWLMSQLRTDAQDAQALISEVDTKMQAYDVILSENDVIIRDAFKDNTVKERIRGDDAGDWRINYDDVNDTISVSGLIPTVDPASISGIYAWYAPENITIDLSNNVLAWPDNTGAGRDLITPGTQPVFEPIDKYVTFTGAESLESGSALDLGISKDYTIFMVVQNDTTGFCILMESSTNINSNNAFILDVNENNEGDFLIGSRGDVGTDFVYKNAAKHVPVLITSEMIRSESARDCAIAINGDNTSVTGKIPPVDNTNFFANNVLYLGARASSSYWFTGRVYEIIIYKRELLLAEKLQLQTYFADKFSL